MSFKKIAPVAFLAVVMASACIYASYPHMSKWAETFAKVFVKEHVNVIDKLTTPSYPVGTFEHEHKRTI